MKEHKACAIRNNLTDKDLEFMKLRALKDTMLKQIPKDKRNQHKWSPLRQDMSPNLRARYLLKCTNCRQTVLGYENTVMFYNKKYHCDTPKQVFIPAAYLQRYILPCTPLK